MQFVTENKKVNLSTLSKSMAENFETCPLRAWKKKRDNRDEENYYLKLGLTAHAMFANKIAEHTGKHYTLPEMTDPEIRREAEEIIENVYFESLLKEGTILGYEERLETILPNGMSLVGIVDLLTLVEDDEFYGSYLKVTDFKTSFKVSKKLDNEALYYAYLVAKTYKMPVYFYRFSGRSNSNWGHFFTYEEAIKLEDSISSYASEIRNVIEGEEEPFPRAGSHCITCPFLNECTEEARGETEIEFLVNKLAFYKANTKILEDKIKNLRMEHGKPMKASGFHIDLSKSKRRTVEIGKKNLIVSLLKSGKLEEFINDIDIKITDKNIEYFKKYGFNFKESESHKLKISEYKGEENED